jgi:hypothetical protein
VEQHYINKGYARATSETCEELPKEEEEEAAEEIVP